MPLGAARMVAPLVGAAVALEIALRAFGPILPGSYRTAPLIEPDPDLGWRHVPSAVIWSKHPDFTARAMVNGQGRLGPEIRGDRRPGTARFLLLGDSYVAATQMTYELTIGGRLAGLLAGSEIVNDGVSGYGTDQAVLVLARDAPHLRPDIAVLMFTVANDVSNNDVNLAAPTYPKPHYVLTDAGDIALRPIDQKPSPFELLRGLLARSALFTALRTGIVDPLAERPSQSYRLELLEVLDEPGGEWLRAWQITLQLIERFASEARSHGAAPLLVIIPEACQVHDDLCEGRPERSGSTLPQDRLRATAARTGLAVLDLLPAFRDQARQGVRLYFPRDLHWNEEGHRLAAELVAGELRTATAR